MRYYKNNIMLEPAGQPDCETVVSTFIESQEAHT